MFAFHGHRGCGSRGMHAMWAHRGRHGWGGESREGGRRRRQIDGGELRLVLLKLIEDAPRHGYDLIRAIEERTGGAYAPSPGVVYPTLTLLADMGLTVEQPGEGARKLYAITDAGRDHLVERAEDVAAVLARLDALGAERNRGDVAPVRRAMGNLRAVLQDKLAGRQVDADVLHQIADLIDEAAKKVERL